MDNPEEMNKIIDPKFLQDYASSVASAVQNYALARGFTQQPVEVTSSALTPLTTPSVTAPQKSFSPQRV